MQQLKKALLLLAIVSSFSSCVIAVRHPNPHRWRNSGPYRGHSHGHHGFRAPHNHHFNR